MSTLFEKLDDGRDGICLYGIAPPKLASTPERLRDIAAEQVDQLRLLAPDGLVGYEDLERDPLAVLGSIYRTFGLASFEELRPRLGAYLGSISGYRKNRLDELPEPLRLRIAHEWGRNFDEWGYER